jgi:hypothetical protein
VKESIPNVIEVICSFRAPRQDLLQDLIVAILAAKVGRCFLGELGTHGQVQVDIDKKLLDLRLVN